MLFCSQLFLVYFTIVFAVYWLLPWERARVWFLLAASFTFYASWNQQLAALIALSTTVDYFLARGLDACSDRWTRRLLLTVSIVGNLGLLCYFKYANFFLGSLEQALNSLGCHTSLPVLKVLLPVGISFYTFEAINYMVDVYQRRVPAERDLANFMLFITFFPHLVAGPIVRARDFLPQIHRPKHWCPVRFELGAQLLLLGMFKKLAIADRMAAFVDPVFLNPGIYSSAAVWLAVLAYALQIYCDFSGYSDMALGTAHLLGYRLARNFNMPYIASSIAEFWHRWHISLSTWLRDYLYIPLGGSRGGRWLTHRNLLLTMTLGGLWHGASWTFVLWGLLHGLLLCGHRLWSAAASARPRLSALLRSPPGRAVCVALTFLTVSLAWVLFRATSLDNALAVFGRLVTLAPGASVKIQPSAVLVTVLVMAVCHAVALGRLWERWLARLPAPVLGCGYAAVLTLALVLAPDTDKVFIYFQF
jgi:alginate O-acetyltransferase complex protein AlgI